MNGAAALVLMLSAMAAFFAGVENEARVCYFGPPPGPDPDNPDDWMKQVIQEIRERCPGRRQPTPSGHTTIGKESTPAGHSTMGIEPTPAGHSTMEMEPTPAAECSSPEPLGMEDGTIPDDRITASSSDSPAKEGRLNNNNNAWLYSIYDTNPWIEVDLVERTVVSGVITQGFRYWYVTEYKVAYKKQPSSGYEHVTDGNGNITVFIGNIDADIPATNLFNDSVVATVVRIVPIAWKIGVAVKLELLGCRRN